MDSPPNAIRTFTAKVSIDAFFQMVKENQYKIQYRVMLSRYRGKTTCPKCHGTRLKPEADYVKIGGRSISDLVQMPVVRLKDWFDHLEPQNRSSRSGSGCSQRSTRACSSCWTWDWAT